MLITISIECQHCDSLRENRRKFVVVVVMCELRKEARVIEFVEPREVGDFFFQNIKKKFDNLFLGYPVFGPEVPKKFDESRGRRQ